MLHRMSYLDGSFESVLSNGPVLSAQGKNTEPFQNKLLSRKFVPKRDQVTEGQRKQYNEELSDLYSS